MKKQICFCLLMCGLLFLTGCGSAFPDETTISVDKKGRITSTIVEEFGKSYYNSEDLQAEIEEEIAVYNEKFATDHVTLKKFEVKDAVAKLKREYGESAYYADFTGNTLYVGTLQEAEEAGYDLSGEYMGADGSLTDADTLESAHEHAKVLILEEAVQAEVPGTILAVSPSDNVTITGKKTAAVQNAELSYIIYQ